MTDTKDIKNYLETVYSDYTVLDGYGEQDYLDFITDYATSNKAIYIVLTSLTNPTKYESGLVEHDFTKEYVIIFKTTETDIETFIEEIIENINGMSVNNKTCSIDAIMIDGAFKKQNLFIITIGAKLL
jgi:hypothetical protein